MATLAITEKLNNDLSVITICLTKFLNMALSNGIFFFKCFVCMQRLKTMKIRCYTISLKNRFL